MALSNLENPYPEETNANRSNADNRAAEEQQHKDSEDDIVDREYLGRLHKNPVDRVEDIDVPKDIATAVLADRIFSLINCSQCHRYPCYEGY